MIYYFILYNEFCVYYKRFETAPLRGSMVQTVTGNLLEEQTAVRFEFFKGINSLWLRSYYTISTQLLLVSNIYCTTSYNLQ
jgi:hypothetical protein